jgi:Fur family ferric uptake transcriptional regulator
VKKEKTCETEQFERTKMQKDLVIQLLKERGCRITKQRLLLLDVILEEECSCCKEIYYRAVEKDEGIGTATVYRMINILEEIGAISRKNMYKIDCDKECEMANACTVELDDDTVYHFSAKTWKSVILEGLKAHGYVDGQEIRSVMVPMNSKKKCRENT